MLWTPEVQMTSRDALRRVLNERGYGSVQVYGTEDDPVFGAGIVPVHDAWEIYREAMPKKTPCHFCFLNGYGAACLDGQCPAPH